MGSEVKVELNHKKIEELRFNLEKLSYEIGKEYLEDVIKADVVPVDTGALLKSLTVRKTEDGAVIKSDLPYADVRYHVNPRNPDKTLWFERVSVEPAVKRVIKARKGELG